MEDESHITLYGRLIDKFGDNGITAALIACQEGEEARIELWIMSCRVFKRQLEYAMFDRLVEACRQRGIKRHRSDNYPTAKNKIIKE